tara:strand:+ start:308 stop:835 length:528 start_codon:yes stop_codon:yes gene_type:complete
MAGGFNPIKVQVIDGTCSIYVDDVLVASYNSEEFTQDPDKIKPVLGEFGIERIDMPLGLYLLDGRCIYVFRKTPYRFLENRNMKATYVYKYFDIGRAACTDSAIQIGTLLDTDYALKRMLKINDENQLRQLLMIPKIILRTLKNQQSAIEEVISIIDNIENPETEEDTEETDDNS